MYIWEVELVIRAEMRHSLFLGEDGQLQFCRDYLPGLVWLASAAELRDVCDGKEYLEVTVVAPSRLADVWASTFHDVVVVPAEGYFLCFGPRDPEGWRWTLTRDFCLRHHGDAWELSWADGSARCATWDEVVAVVDQFD